MSSNETTPLLLPSYSRSNVTRSRRLGGTSVQQNGTATSPRNHVIDAGREILLGKVLADKSPTVNNYVTIDFLQDLVDQSSRQRGEQRRLSLRAKFLHLLDHAGGWIAAILIGALTACVAAVVDVAEATVSDWKLGYCRNHLLATRKTCCSRTTLPESGECESFQVWSTSFWPSFGIFLGFALAFGLFSGSITMLTKHSFPLAASRPVGVVIDDEPALSTPMDTQKTMYMASGSGIPELRTILAGFEIPNFLTLRVMTVKAIGAIFAVATGMCLGKEGPFVHISGCVGHLVANMHPRYRNSPRKMRQMLSIACAAGLSVAFGAPIGGVLFSYEEISTYFPRQVLWKAFLCSLSAALVLKELNPLGTGRLILFETNFATSYTAAHYLIFVMLGIAGGIFGGIFCNMNFLWSKWFRGFSVIKKYPVFETFLVVLTTVLLQYPNILAREPGDTIIKNLLVDCRDPASKGTIICRSEAQDDRFWYYCYLVSGSLTKLFLTVITFGIKVPSGVIIPFLDSGAYFGRLVGQAIPGMSPGIFAMVGAGAFLAGVSRMTISLGVIMLELTGDLEFVLPNMIAILVAKSIADVICPNGVYEIAQTLQGHPFLDSDRNIEQVQGLNIHAGDLIDPDATQHVLLNVPRSNRVSRHVLASKVGKLKKTGLMNLGIVLVQDGQFLAGHLGMNELESWLNNFDTNENDDVEVYVLREETRQDTKLDVSQIVNRTPLSVPATAPLEYVLEIFGQLGVRRLIITEERSTAVVGVIDKRQLIVYLHALEGH